jgi:hypothetical protein
MLRKIDGRPFHELQRGKDFVQRGLGVRGRTGKSDPQYRCYNLENDGRAITARIDITLDNDATASACAKQLIVGEEIQVWQRLRLVTSLHSLADASYIASAA